MPISWHVECGDWDLQTLMNELYALIEQDDVFIELEALPAVNGIEITNEGDSVHRVEEMLDELGVDYVRNRG